MGIHAFPGLEEKLPAWCEKHQVTLCVFEEADDENPTPHYHMAVSGSEVSDTAARKWLAELLPAKKTTWCLRWDGQEEFLRYCCKGPDWQSVKRTKTKQMVPTPPRVIYTTYSADQIKSYHEAFWIKNAVIQEERKQGAPKSRDELIDAAVEACQHINNYDHCITALTNFVIGHYRGVCSDHQVFPVIQGAYYRLNKRICEYSFEQRMRDRLRIVCPRGYLNLSCTNTISVSELISDEEV